MIGHWRGRRLIGMLNRTDIDTTARHAGFERTAGCREGIDMATAPHPRGLMAFKLSDDILPTRRGCPFKITIPTKFGTKDPPFVTANYVTNQSPPGFWTDRGDH